MLDDSVSIDIVICTYNNASLLEQVLRAIARQKTSDHVDWSVVVVDNNCTDSTAVLVEQFIQAGQIPGLRRVIESRQGLTNARLCGVRQTTADWIALVDDDCLLEDDWIQQAAAFAQLHPNCGAFGGRVILDWETLPPDYVLPYGYSFAQQEHGFEPKQVSSLVGAGLIVNRSALIQTGWMEHQFMSDRVGKKLISGGDVELALRLAAQFPLWYNPACKLRHIIPSWRITQEYLRKINYGLGTSQAFGESMVWEGSYPNLLWTSIQETSRASYRTGTQILKNAVKRRHLPATGIDWSFLQGKWVGIWRLWQMHPELRRSLLGCAKVNHW